jgi:GTPase KRas protein
MDVRLRPDNRCARLSVHAQTFLTNPPPEDSYSVTRTVDGVPYYLMLTDTAGQEEYRGLWAASNLKSDAFLLVYDITSPSSLESLEYFMEMIDMEEESRIDNGKTPPVKIVAGNKCDLQGQRQITSKDGLEWARRRKCGFMETSAREMVNIEETFARECPADSEQRGWRWS